MSPGRIIENPVTGERIVILRTAAETGGELLSFELVLRPGGHVPAGHAHPEQQERFTVVDGRVRFRVGGRARVAVAGDTVTVPRGASHSFANLGPGEARLLVEARPALRTADMLEAGARLTGRRPIPSPLSLALFLQEYRREVSIPFLPATVARAITAPLAALARLLHRRP